jgi:hypothetical protein
LALIERAQGGGEKSNTALSGADAIKFMTAQGGG